MTDKEIKIGTIIISRGASFTTKHLEEISRQFKRLEADYKQLQHYLACMTEQRNRLETENAKLQSTIAKIKEIADARCDECKYGKDRITCKFGDCGEAKLHLITQLINESEEYNIE